jgi:hypothetical protein
LAKSPIASGAKYLAVVITDRRNRPFFSPFRSLSDISRFDSASITSRQPRATRLPASVRKIFRPICSNSGMPTVSERLFTCAETVGWVRNSSSAARVKLPSRATASTISICRRVACRRR